MTLKQKEAELNIVYPYSKSYGKTSLTTVLGGSDQGRSLVRSCHLGAACLGRKILRYGSRMSPCMLLESQIGRTLRVGGWVKTGREAGAGAFAFLEVNDGSSFESLQVGPYTIHHA